MSLLFFQSAHMAVIESLMALFAKECVSRERLCAALQRFGLQQTTEVAPNANTEQALLSWLNASLEALKNRAKAEL